MRFVVKTMAVFLVLTVFGACSTWTLPNRRAQLVSKVQDFTQHLRWKDINGAAGYFEKGPAERFREMFAETDDLHIVEVKVDRVEMLRPGNATVVFDYQYYELPSITVRTHEVEQEWVLHHGEKARSGEWKIVSEFPERL